MWQGYRPWDVIRAGVAGRVMHASSIHAGCRFTGRSWFARAARRFDESLSAT
jgi:hypothetical protein